MKLALYSVYVPRTREESVFSMQHHHMLSIAESSRRMVLQAIGVAVTRGRKIWIRWTRMKSSKCARLSQNMRRRSDVHPARETIRGLHGTIYWCSPVSEPNIARVRLASAAIIDRSKCCYIHNGRRIHISWPLLIIGTVIWMSRYLCIRWRINEMIDIWVDKSTNVIVWWMRKYTCYTW